MPALLAVWSFLKSPLGRYLAATVAVALALVAYYRWAYDGGVKHQLALDARAEAAAKANITRHETKAAAISTTAQTNLAKAKIVIQDRIVTQIKEVPVYVTVEADAQCVVPTGFVSLWNDGARGEASLPAAPGGPVDTPSGVQLSAVLAADLGNDGVAYGWRAEALTWRQWYADQAAAWAKP